MEDKKILNKEELKTRMKQLTENGASLDELKIFVAEQGITINEVDTKNGPLSDEELEKRGFEVLVTRKDIDDNPELAPRGRMAGENGCQLFLSLHSNAPGHKLDEQGNIWYDPSVTGTVVYYSLTRPENRELKTWMPRWQAHGTSSPNVSARQHRSVRISAPSIAAEG